ncbi:cation efflux family protein [Purpureocillium lavendulum]|uniref:Cation efflux family protein n=1 Tax=Purpureocillium lavendulum TaxID=1247861 RepID=A0AB34G159_9HYPO|nr:cation efflux family protein [Purpureocillium lavendulum]
MDLGGPALHGPRRVVRICVWGDAHEGRGGGGGCDGADTTGERRRRWRRTTSIGGRGGGAGKRRSRSWSSCCRRRAIWSTSGSGSVSNRGTNRETTHQHARQPPRRRLGHHHYHHHDTPAPWSAHPEDTSPTPPIPQPQPQPRAIGSPFVAARIPQVAAFAHSCSTNDGRRRFTQGSPRPPAVIRVLVPDTLASSSSSPSHLFLHHNLDASVALAPSVLLHLAPIRGRIRSLPGIMGAAQQQTRDHGDHGHGHGHGHHHHHHDNTYLISANKNDSGVRITRIGLLSNLGMAVAKFIGGWAFNSKSMTADAWHSIADLASDILTLATVSWSLKPPSDRFPLGFGKVESLGSLGVSGMLLIGGFYMGWESAISLYGHFNPEAAHGILEHMGGHGHSHSHSAASLGIPSIHAAWLAAGTILIKEWLYHATMKVARERKSSVLASNAVHHRVDSLTGIVTLAAILGANVFENAAWLDPVGGLLISIMVVNAGFENTKSALYELADQSIDDEVKGSVRKQAHRALANVSEGHEAELRDVSGIKSGQNYLVDLEMAVPGKWTVEDVKDLEDAVRTLVGGKVRGVRRVRVRFVSRDAPVNERFDEFIPGSVHVEADPEPRENGDAEDKSAAAAAAASKDEHRH